MEIDLAREIDAVLSASSSNMHERTAAITSYLLDYKNQVKKEQLMNFHEAEARLCGWMLISLNDPNVCDQMKLDITRWFSFFGTIDNDK